MHAKALPSPLSRRRTCTQRLADQSEFAQLEEAFAVIHKATLHVIKEERDRDAAPRAGKRRSARRVYQVVQQRVQRVVEMRLGYTASALSALSAARIIYINSPPFSNRKQACAKSASVQ